jgi:hypothetical protein
LVVNSLNPLCPGRIERLIEERIHRMLQPRTHLERRIMHPPRMNKEEPTVSHRPERVNAQAVSFLPRGPCHVAHRFLYRFLFPSRACSRTNEYSSTASSLL